MTHRSCFLVAVLVGVALGCGKDDGKGADAPLPPALGVLELPVSLRTGDPAPGGSYKVEANPSELRVDGKVIVPLTDGRVPAAEQQGGVVGALKSAFGGGRAELALHLHSTLPYETTALVLNTAASAGVRNASFQVRKPGGTPDTGWIAVKGFSTTPRTDQEVPLPAVTPRKWDDFTVAWQAVYDACRMARTGSCAYVQTNVAQGGNLKIVLHASGRGVNLNFHRVGFSAEELAAEKQKRESELGEKKRAFLDGRMKQLDLEAELLEGDPATEALFQFRAEEALNLPSALSSTLGPLCGTGACGAVVSADSNTLMVRVMSLIGAAFPDGTPAPSLAFELPWTEKPKPVVTEAQPAPAEAPTAEK